VHREILCKDYRPSILIIH